MHGGVGLQNLMVRLGVGSCNDIPATRFRRTSPLQYGVLVRELHSTMQELIRASVKYTPWEKQGKPASQTRMLPFIVASPISPVCTPLHPLRVAEHLGKTTDLVYLWCLFANGKETLQLHQFISVLYASARPCSPYLAPKNITTRCVPFPFLTWQRGVPLLFFPNQNFFFCLGQPKILMQRIDAVDGLRSADGSQWSINVGWLVSDSSRSLVA